MTAVTVAGRSRPKRKPPTPEQKIELQQALAAQEHTTESHAWALREARVKLPILIGIICGLIVSMLTDQALQPFAAREPPLHAMGIEPFLLLAIMGDLVRQLFAPVIVLAIGQLGGATKIGGPAGATQNGAPIRAHRFMRESVER